MELTKASENIWDRMERYDPYYKRLESVDKEEEIICRLE